MRIRTASLPLACLAALLASACTTSTATGTDAGSAPAANDSGSSDDGSPTDASGGSADASTSTPDSGTPDAAGADGGTPDAAGPTGDGSAVLGNGCADPPATNTTRATAQAYAIGTQVRSCVRSSMDVQYFEYTVPTMPAKGSWVVVSLNDVDAAGALDLTTEPVLDSGVLVNAYTTNGGGGVFNAFTAKPGAAFRAVVKPFTLTANASAAYTLAVTVVGVNDPSAPNGTRATAATLQAGTAAQGYFFAGHDTSNAPANTDWDSWYKVTLGGGDAGMATLSLTNVSPDTAPYLHFYDSNGSEIQGKYSTTQGADITFAAAAASMGTYYLMVEPFAGPPVTATTPSTPPFIMSPFSVKAVDN